MKVKTPEVLALLAAVNETYDKLEAQGQFVTHTLEVTSRELTEVNERIRKESETELRRVSNYFEQTLDQQPNLTFRVEKQGTILPSNYAGAACWNALAQFGQLEGKQAPDLFPVSIRSMIPAWFEPHGGASPRLSSLIPRMAHCRTSQRLFHSSARMKWSKLSVS